MQYEPIAVMKSSKSLVRGSPFKKKLWSSTFFVITWIIWYDRNLIKFQNKTTNLKRLQEDMKLRLAIWNKFYAPKTSLIQFHRYSILYMLSGLRMHSQQGIKDAQVLGSSSYQKCFHGGVKSTKGRHKPIISWDGLIVCSAVNLASISPVLPPRASFSSLAPNSCTTTLKF